MQRLFDLMVEYKSNLLNYKVLDFYEKAIIVADSGLEHVPDDFITFLGIWNRLLEPDSEELINRIFPHFKQIGLTLQAMAFAYVVSQAPEDREFIKEYLGLGIKVMPDEIQGPVCYKRINLEQRANDLISKHNPEDLIRIRKYIQDTYEEFFRIYGADFYQAGDPVEDEMALGMLHVSEHIRTGIPPSDEKYLELVESYGGKERFDALRLISNKIIGPQRAPFNILCETLVSYKQPLIRKLSLKIQDYLHKII